MCEPIVYTNSLISLIERVAKIADGVMPISNKELIELCREYGVFKSTVDSHIFHEIAETAVNSLILKKYGSHLLTAVDPVEAVSTIELPGREFYCNGTSVKTTLIIGTKPIAPQNASADHECVPHIVARSVEHAFEQSLKLNIRF